MLKRVYDFSKDQCGATLVEYGVALIVAIVVGGVGLTQLGGETTDNMLTAECSLPNTAACQ